MIRILSLVFIFFSALSFAQKDTNSFRGTIRISNAKDTVYVKTKTSFLVYPKRLTDNPASYKSFVRSTEMPQSSRVRVLNAHPQSSDKDSFDYTAFFSNNAITREIRMESGEKDTVRIMVYVDKKGRMAFTDLSPPEIISRDTIVFSKNRKSYKIDRTHKKTQRAFASLGEDDWIPAEIQSLKKHPSKKKNKYIINKAYMQGVLTIIYSSEPFKEE